MEETVRRAQAEVYRLRRRRARSSRGGAAGTCSSSTAPSRRSSRSAHPHPSMAPIYRRRCPQWWWPEDRRWFVATEIDYPWTYVGGPAGLIHEIVEDTGLEGVEVARPTAGEWRSAGDRAVVGPHGQRGADDDDADDPDHRVGDRVGDRPGVARRRRRVRVAELDAGRRRTGWSPGSTRRSSAARRASSRWARTCWP